MAREQFIDSLRLASRMLGAPRVSSEQGGPTDVFLASRLQNADLWLTTKCVEGFDPADFPDLSREEREELENEVAAFSAIAEKVAPNAAATKQQSGRARKHLERAIQIVGSSLLREWIEAQNRMLNEAIAAAKEKGWYFQEDQKELLESLLGSYHAPRLRIRTADKEVVLDPVARFGSGRQGVVDLVTMPTYETAYLVTFKNGQWRIVSPHGSASSRPFTQTTLVNTIARLPRR